MFASAEGNAYPETVGRYVVATLLGAGLVLAPLGCSLLLNDDFSNPSATEAGQPDVVADLDATTELDGDAIEAATTSDADAADAPPDPNLLVNPSFETNDCAGWLTEFAVATEIDIARSGVRGCLVCAVAGHFQAQFYQQVSMPVPPNTAFLGELWVRAAPGEPAPPSDELGLEVDIRSETEGIPIQFGTPTFATNPLSSEWARINAATTSNIDAGTAVQLFLHFPAETRTCVVVDSARLVRTTN